MVAIANTGIVVKCNNRNILTNICITPNGTRIAKIGGFYFKVNNNNTVTSCKKWYVGNDKGFEIWQSEKLINGYYKIVESKKKIA